MARMVSGRVLVALTTIMTMVSVVVVVADDTTHIYEDGASVKIYANKIGPYNNPLETYAYFERPGCKPATEDHKFPSLGQALVGDEHFEMSMKITFPKSMEAPADLCAFTPSVKDAHEWQSMVEAQYWYQLLVDDLPMWGVFGNRSAEKKPEPGMPPQVHQIYTLQNISLGYNGNRIVSANLSVHHPVVPVVGVPMRFQNHLQLIYDCDVSGGSCGRDFVSNTACRFGEDERWRC
ncbi:endomembrane protein 70, putative [Bodo saltans]|uniref:Transmembrane 9 superfamily member n=1 Tax=Bodo saltans TaxID=75058 RepID=A0A0S4J7X5_BODSA|nr:endomembrane protein 70, putative [Bodo saltans]|eukprot:CUG87606.1 endomembrane protein 70, putative [Bodo saltans]